MSDFLNVEKREETGTLRMRRMRQAGKVPGVLYGHGEGTALLSISAKDLRNVINQGQQIVTLKGDLTDSALIKDIQWDPMGDDVLHLDLARVNLDESVEVALQVELVGVAPGTRSGGNLRVGAHEIEIACPANKLPDKLELKINDLQLDQSLTASDVPIPDGATLLTAPDALIVSCVVSEEKEEEEADVVEAGAAEPEVIGRKSEDEEGSDD